MKCDSKIVMCLKKLLADLFAKDISQLSQKKQMLLY